MRKIFSIFLICFFISYSIPISLSSTVNINRTIYVDDDNIEGPWDGTQEHPFQYIQDGIDSATVGDTVFVFGGIYFENVIVDKSIVLQGEDRNTTIIKPLNVRKIINICCDEVCVKGFEISDGKYGIYLNNSRGSIISNNLIQNNSLFGINVGDFVNDTLIENNLIKNNSFGLYFSSYGTVKNKNPLIIGNNIIKNNIDVNVYGVSNILIQDNHIGLISLSECEHTTIVDNIITENGVFFEDSFDNTIMNNRFFQSGISFDEIAKHSADIDLLAQRS